MDYEIELIDAEPQPALAIESVCAQGEIARVLGVSFGRIVTHIIAGGGAPEGMPFLRYLEMSETSLRIQAGIPSSGEGRDEIQSLTLPGGKLATSLYLGPYDGVGAAWDDMGKWAQARGLGIQGGWDVYENDPDTVADPSELRTRLYLAAE